MTLRELLKDVSHQIAVRIQWLDGPGRPTVTIKPPKGMVNPYGPSHHPLAFERLNDEVVHISVDIIDGEPCLAIVTENPSPARRSKQNRR
jgi:hypothetical protein